METQNPKDRPVLEASLESGEVIVDILMRGDALADIPLIGTAIKICKAADSIRDQAFALKLSRFIISLESITEEQKNKLKEKMNAGTKEVQKIGETLLFVIERITDLDKPSLLAQLFMAYIDGVITSEEFRRLCQAVDTAFADDLQQLLTAEKVSPHSDEPWMFNLVTCGLTRLVGGVLVSELGALHCELTPLAEKLRNVYIQKNMPEHKSTTD